MSWAFNGAALGMTLTLAAGIAVLVAPDEAGLVGHVWLAAVLAIALAVVLGRLTALFAWARFSGHDVRPEMKDEAIDTLEEVQRELAAAAAAREAERAVVAA